MNNIQEVVHANIHALRMRDCDHAKFSVGRRALVHANIQGEVQPNYG